MVEWGIGRVFLPPVNANGPRGGNKTMFQIIDDSISVGPSPFYKHKVVFKSMKLSLIGPTEANC